MGGRDGESGLKGLTLFLSGPSSRSGILPFLLPANDFSFQVENLDMIDFGDSDDSGAVCRVREGENICVGAMPGLDSDTTSISHSLGAGLGRIGGAGGGASLEDCLEVVDLDGDLDVWCC